MSASHQGRLDSEGALIALIFNFIAQVLQGVFAIVLAIISLVG